jgi:hypothetical protein
MRRHLAPALLSLVVAGTLAASIAQTQESPPPQEIPPAPATGGTRYVGPTMMLFGYSDSTWIRRADQWNTDSTNNYEKMLWTDLKMRFWHDHLPSDMRMVFDTLGYPTGRVLLTPVGHTEELWYYSQNARPLRFVDGALVNPAQFEAFQQHRAY